MLGTIDAFEADIFSKNEVILRGGKSMETIKLSSGHLMPMVGMGTWRLQGEACKVAVKKAVEMGYTHIDTAWMYGNQTEIGEALRELSMDREQLFITTKVWHTHLRYDEVLTQFDECLNQLQMDYVDLLLIHHPNESVPLQETLGAFNEIHNAGQTKSIGISNFSIPQVEQAKLVSVAPIVTNQVEYNVRSNKEALLAHCTKHGVVLTAHRPLAVGEIVREKTLQAIGKKYGKTAAQVALRWLLQKGMIVIPKSGSEAHLRENLDVLDWALTVEEMERIDSISG